LQQDWCDGGCNLDMSVFDPSSSAILPPLDLEEIEIRDGLCKHVDMLANLIGERNYRVRSALDAAAAYIERTFQITGYQTRSQSFTVDDWIARNIDVEIPGHIKPKEIILVGAHYDSAIFCPGANDNATGIAAILELARLLRSRPLVRSVRLVAFVNEEPPFFQTDHMGSRVYARQCREQNENIIAMLCPETIGCYFDDPGTQRYPIRIPFPFNLIYTNRGNYIML
jgi:Zn-dependent M28 family amino/carboxypeptidase